MVGAPIFVCASQNRATAHENEQSPQHLTHGECNYNHSNSSYSLLQRTVVAVVGYLLTCVASKSRMVTATVTATTTITTANFDLTTRTSRTHEHADRQTDTRQRQEERKINNEHDERTNERCTMS